MVACVRVEFPDNKTSFPAAERWMHNEPFFCEKIGNERFIRGFLVVSLTRLPCFLRGDFRRRGKLLFFFFPGTIISHLS